MGKRELVLISIFVVLGALVYQFTAPPPPPGSESFSVGGIVDKVRREIQGSRETSPAEWTHTIAVPADVRELRVNMSRPNDLTVTGEDRSDIAVELRAVGRGYDQADAKVAAGAARLRIERIGDGIVVSFDPALQRTLPKDARIDQVVVGMKVPQRLAIRAEPHSGKFVVANLASGEIMGSRGETRIKGMTGHLQLTHTGGRLEVESVRSLKLIARSSRGSIKSVAGLFTLEATGGELEIGSITGPLDAELRNAAITLTALKSLKPPLRLNASGGRLMVDGLRTEARIDGRDTDIEVRMEAAAPVTIYNTSEDILVTAPPNGYTLDAVATEGNLDLQDGTLKQQDEAEARVSGAVRGGGPTLTLRVTRSNITLRKPEGK